jgi:hypothetical protein
MLTFRVNSILNFRLLRFPFLLFAPAPSPFLNGEAPDLALSRFAARSAARPLSRIFDAPLASFSTLFSISRVFRAKGGGRNLLRHGGFGIGNTARQCVFRFRPEQKLGGAERSRCAIDSDRDTDFWSWPILFLDLAFSKSLFSLFLASYRSDFRFRRLEIFLSPPRNFSSTVPITYGPSASGWKISKFFR